MTTVCSYTDKELTDIINQQINIKPIAIFMVGAPASGKSSIKKSFVTNYLGKRMNEFIDCDPDVMNETVKSIALSKHPKSDVSQINCYEEAWKLNDIIYMYAIRNNLSLILDGTGHNFAWYSGQIENLWYIGYSIYICIVDVDNVENIIERAHKRVGKGTRSIPLTEQWISDIRTKFEKIKANIPLYKAHKRATGAVIYDNTYKNGEAKIVEIYKHGKKQKYVAGTYNENTKVYKLTNEAVSARSKGEKKLKKKKKTATKKKKKTATKKKSGNK